MKRKTFIERLKEIRNLIDTPEKWTKKSDGNEVGTFSKEATCFCLVGAVVRCDKHHSSDIILKLGIMARKRFDKKVEEENNERTRKA